MKEAWLEQYESDSTPERLAAEAEAARVQATRAEERLAQEREWAGRHPREWSEWVRLSSLLMPTYDFGAGGWYDFPQFLDDVGPSPAARHVIRRRGETLPYQSGNLEWAAQQGRQINPRPIESPYLTVGEAAEYCRRSPKTILNHHSLGNVRSMPGTRPLLFRREDLDTWLSARRKSRKK